MFRRRLLDVNAFYWLAGRARLKPLHVWAFFGLIAGAWVWGRWEVGGEWFSPGIYFTTGCVVNSVLKFWVASAAGRRLGEDRRIGALELLLSTPLSVRDILHGQWLALRRQFFLPIVFVLVVEFTFMVASIRKEGYQSDPGYLAIWLALMLMLVVDSISLAWVGMWVALTSRNPNRATGHTVLRLLILPWLGMVVVIMISSVIRPSLFDSGKFLLGLWVGTGLVTDLVFALSAGMQLHSRFRQVATESVRPERSLLRRWFAGHRTAAARAESQGRGGSK